MLIMSNEGKKGNSATEKAHVRTSFAHSLVSIINGSYFNREDVVKRMPFILFLVGLALIYIANGYNAEETIRQMNKVEMELKELRSEYITSKSDLMHKSKQSEVAKMLGQQGVDVRESLEPPKKIVIKKGELN